EITDLMHILDSIPLFPNAIFEATPSGPVARVGFVSSDGSWRLALASKRFDFSHISTEPLGSDLGEFQGFCEQAARTLVTVLERFGRTSHRLAAVREGYLREMTSNEMQRVAERLL